MYHYDELTGCTYNDLNRISENLNNWPKDIVEYIITNSKDGFNKEDSEKRIYMYKNGIEKLLDLDDDSLRNLITSVKEINFDEVKNIRTIEEPCYELLDRKLNDDKYIYISEPFNLYYAAYGQYLMLIGSIEQAYSYFKKAIELNPYSPESYIGMTSYYLETGQLSKVLELSIQGLKYAFDSEYISILFQNIGYYGLVTFNDDLAKAGFTVFIQTNKDADTCTLMVKDILPKFEIVNDDELRKIFDKYNIPFGYDSGFFDMVYAEGIKSYENQEFESAKYYLTIFSIIGKSDKVEAILEELYKEN